MCNYLSTAVSSSYLVYSTAGASGKPPAEEVAAPSAPTAAPPGFVPLPEGQPTVRVDTSQPPPLRPEMGKAS